MANKKTYAVFGLGKYGMAVAKELVANGEHFKDKSLDEARELMVSFAEAAKKVPNSVRCAPVGTPTPFMLYVGCECSPQDGRNIYNRLIDEFPDHECQRNCDSRGYNATQRMMKEKGLMK